MPRSLRSTTGSRRASGFSPPPPSGVTLIAMLKEFKEFAMKGNVLDLAVGVIIGAAFGKIVNSLVNDVIMPPIGLLVGKIDFSNLPVSLCAP